MEVTTTQAKETGTLGERLGQLLEPGDLIALEGDLGAGKTVFVQGLARGLGVTDLVNSPTYVIIQTYDGRLPLFHFDVYRLGSGDELEELGYEEFFYGSGVTVVEWAQLIESYLPSHHLTIKITLGPGENDRAITFIPQGSRYEKLVEELSRDASAGH